MPRDQILRRRIRWLLAFFIVCLVASGLTAFPLQWELDTLAAWLGIPEGASPDAYDGLRHWIAKAREGVHATFTRWPFMAYGTDWLAFAHLIIAVAFIGPLRDPVRNAWVITWGMIACIGVIPLALICGEIREIPLYWRLIDCSFGVFGLLPLWICQRSIRELSALESAGDGA
jgi:hypothetical protein